MFSLIFEPGLCGLGYSTGLFPEVRLILLRVSWCRGSILSKLRHYEGALAVARRMVGR